MKNNKNDMTLEEHRELGEALKHIHIAAQDTLCNGKVLKSSREYRLLHRLLSTITQVKGDFDSRLCRENPSLTLHEITNFYYHSRVRKP